MALSEDLAGLASSGSDKRDLPPRESWRPQLELDKDGGFLVSTPRESGTLTDSTELLAEFDLDPNEWLVTNVRRSKWQRYDGEWLESFRVSLKPRGVATPQIDVERLVDEIRKFRPPKNSKPATGDLTAVYAMSDTQYGKDAGDGTEGTVRRVRGALDAALARHKELKPRGIGQIALPQLGDCIEGVVSQGGRIVGRLDLTLTQQVRVGRRVLLEWVKAFAPLTESLVVPVVPGNHDETIRHVITDPLDSWQVDVVSQVEDIVRENPAFEHVKFRYPNSDEQTLTVDLSGTLVGLVHGHQARDLVKWWQTQSMGRTPIGAAHVLLSGHYHHYKAVQVGPALWIQTPAMDGGSPWFRDNVGLEAPSGIVSLVVGAGYDPRRDLAILGGGTR